ncbi:inversin-A-like [Clytia hemisphaerica]|uniref:Uncharacterized protein n=1 Tax=Clytia hemisphaerica TaxID=252671 RepID=A0A7M6DMR7_9CNID
MAEKKTSGERSKGRRHKKSEINMAMFLFQASYQGNYQDLQEVLYSDKIKSEKKFVVLNARAADGNPILINCLQGSGQVKEEKDYLECIKVLVSTGIPLDTKDAHGKSAIHWCIILDKYEICTYLLQQGAVLESSKISPLHIAISKKSVPFVKLLCEHKGDTMILEEKDEVGRTPLCHSLLINDSLQIFNELLIAGCDANGQMANGKSLISHIIENNMADFLACILKKNVNLFPHGRNRYNLIHLSAIQKNPGTLQALAQQCLIADMESPDHYGKTPLMHAVENELPENVMILLAKEVNVLMVDNEGNTALHHANRNTSHTIVNMLVPHSPTLLQIANKAQRFPLTNAVVANNQVIVRALLDHGASADVRDGEGHSLIHYAAEYSSTSCLADLGSVGLTLNSPDNHGVFPIHYSVRLDASDANTTGAKIYFLKTLVTMGADLSVADDQGLQPIHWAVCMGFTEAMKILLIEDADVNAITKGDQYCALHLACNCNQFECLELLLLQPTISIDQVDSQGRTALFTACHMKDHRFTETLLQAGANPDHQDKEGKSPAHVAATNVSGDSLWLLSLKRANFELKNKSGETPIHLACKNADDACLRFLLTRRCNVNTTLTNGLSTLHIAVSSKCPNKVSLLLQHGAKRNQIYYGETSTITPLDVALENADHKCIKLLQKYGARTAHYILTQSANLIRTTWKNYHKRKVNRGEAVPLANSSSIYTSSNASESVSTKGVYRDTRQGNQEESSITYENESSEIMTLQGKSTTSSNKDYRYVGELPKKASSSCVEIPDYMLRVLTEEYQREFQEKIKKSDMEIMLMRELMKETEQLLVRAKRLNEDAENLANSQSFRNIKMSNKKYMEEKRKMFNANNNNNKHLTSLQEVRNDENT